MGGVDNHRDSVAKFMLKIPLKLLMGIFQYPGCLVYSGKTLGVEIDVKVFSLDVRPVIPSVIDLVLAELLGGSFSFAQKEQKRNYSQ
jgi:hypothetical protein